MNEPAYPIFFPMYGSIETGFRREWLWYDPEISLEDIGGFRSRPEAVADWAADCLLAALRQEIEGLEQVLALPLLQLGRRPAPVDLQPIAQIADAISLAEELAAAVPLPVQLRLPLEAA